MTKRNSRRLFRAIAVLAGLVLALIVAEAVVRLVFHQAPADLALEGFPYLVIKPEGIRLVPNTHRRILARINSRDIQVDVNAEGFRGPELITGRAPRPFRILFLGDSIVFGPGLEYNETIPSRVEARLGPGYEVINAGIPGMSLADELGSLDQKIDAVEPDLVILGFYLNDPIRSIILTEQYGDLGDTGLRIAASLRAHSALFNWAWQTAAVRKAIKTRSLKTEWPEFFHQRRWIDDRPTYDRIIALADDDFGAAWQEKNWPPVKDRLRLMRDRIQSRGGRLAVVIFPVSLQVFSNVADDYPQQRLQKITADLNVPGYDLLPGLREVKKDQAFLYDQCHYTPAGAALVADLIEKWMKENGLLDKK